LVLLITFFLKFKYLKMALFCSKNATPTPDLNIWLCGRWTDLGVMGVRVGVAIFFSDQSIV